MNRTFNVVADYGANGIGDDWAAFQSALTDAAMVEGVVHVPAGRFHISKPLVLNGCSRNVAIRGEGANVSVILANNTAALSLSFVQESIRQPWGLNLSDLGFEAIGECGTAITISYGLPSATSDHYTPSTNIRGVNVASGPKGSWANGIDIQSAWNVTMTDVFISGNAHGGDWDKMTGSGLRYREMCVNAHHVNVRCNFWAIGFCYHAGNGGNTEGLFFTNCSMVGVQRGAWIIGNANNAAPRVSTFCWTGGMIECRVGGVAGGSAAFHLVNVWTGLIVGCQMLAEVLPTTHTTYGLFLDNCVGVVVTGCDINAWHKGLFTVGQCYAISSHGNTFTNCGEQTVFNPGTAQSRSYGHVNFGEGADFDNAGVNKMGFIA